MQADQRNADDPAFRRQVFYIPGFDPHPPRRYRELYRREAAAQAALSGYQIAVQPGPCGAAYGWRVSARIEGRQVETAISVLVWSDIVRDRMAGGIAATYVQLAQTVWAYLATGALFRLMRLRKGPVIAALYPPVVLLLQLAVAALAGVLVFRLGSGIAGGWSAAALGLGVVWSVLHGFRRIDRHLYAWYLMHDYAFAARHRGAYPDALEARIGRFGAAVAGALKTDVDEVLVVGHSSGAYVAVSVLADMVRAGLPGISPALSLLTLGQVVPMVAFLPGARRLRADLAVLANGQVPWVDVTAPGDGCAFALCDPVAVSGVARAGKKWPLVLSAAFTQTLSPARWQALRWRFFRLHFQYLCAFDALPGRTDDYDYFRITAGPLTLADRLGGRKPSASRIERAVSRYTDRAA